MQRHARSALVLAAFVALLALVASRTNALDRWLAKDFLEYWSAGWLNLRGENPYDPAKLLAAQQLADSSRREAVMMWNPPPSLAVYMPVALAPAKWAAPLWACLQLAAILLAAILIWRAYAPGASQWPAAILAVLSPGTWWVVTYGQNTGLILLGLAGFLHFRQKDRPLAAGACAALTALKPHLLAVFGVLLVADAVGRRGREALAAGAGAVAVALGLACVTNPHVVTQFVEAARHPAEGAVPLSHWALPVPAYWLRMWLAPHHFWAQFVPCAAGCAGFLLYRAWKGAAWDWSRELPLVVAASVLTTPYGGWLFDLPVLLVPVTWAAARLASAKRWALVGAFALGQGALTAASLAWPRGLHDYWWVAPAALALCLIPLACKSRS